MTKMQCYFVLPSTSIAVAGGRLQTAGLFGRARCRAFWKSLTVRKVGLLCLHVKKSPSIANQMLFGVPRQDSRRRRSKARFDLRRSSTLRSDLTDLRKKPGGPRLDRFQRRSKACFDLRPARRDLSRLHTTTAPRGCKSIPRLESPRFLVELL